MEGHRKAPNGNAHNKQAPETHPVDVFRIEKQIGNAKNFNDLLGNNAEQCQPAR